MYVFTDGAAKSNGRSSCVASYGVFAPDLNVSKYNGKVLRDPSNQRGELMGVQRALEILMENDVHDAVIVTDSLYAIKCLTTWSSNWKRNGWKTAKGDPVKHSDLIQSSLEILQSNPAIRLQHIRSHQPRPVEAQERYLWQGNRTADELATLAIAGHG